MERTRTFTGTVAAAVTAALVLFASGAKAEKGNWNYDLPDWVLQTGKTENPQFKWDVESGGWFFNFGPTGIRVKFDLDSPRAAKVMYVFPNSPADGKIMKGDEIVGVNGKRFTTDEPFPPARGSQESFAITGPRLEVAKAIEDTEGDPGKNGMLSFLVTRKGATSEVLLKLEPIGYFSPTFPYNCRKSRILAEKAGDWLVKEGKGGRPAWGPRMGAHIDNIGQLALLSFGDKYRELLEPSQRDYDSDWAPLWSWIVGIMGITTAEKQQSFNDKKLVPRLERVCSASVSKQGPAGQYSHKNYNPEGYKLAFPTGLNGLTLALTQKCGGKIDEEAYLRTRYLLTYSSGEQGNIGYGAHSDAPISLSQVRSKAGNVNPSAVRADEEAKGRLVGGSACTTLIHFIDPRDSFSEAFVKRGVRYAMSARWTSRHAHSAGSLTMVYNTIAASLGPVVGEDEMYRKYMDDMKHWLNMARCHDGSYYFEPKIDTEMIPAGRVLVTSAAILMLNAPLRELYVNGKGRTDPGASSAASTAPEPSTPIEPPKPVRKARSLAQERRRILDTSLKATLAKLSDNNELKAVPIGISPTRARVWLKKAENDGKLTFQVVGGSQTASFKWDDLGSADHATLSLLLANLKPESKDAQAMAGVYMEALGKIEQADKYYEAAGESSAGKLQRLFE